VEGSQRVPASAVLAHTQTLKVLCVRGQRVLGKHPTIHMIIRSPKGCARSLGSLVRALNPSDGGVEGVYGGAPADVASGHLHFRVPGRITGNRSASPRYD
jgi:hypothetical protein